MPRSKSQLARLLKLDQLLRDGEFPNCTTFGKSVEVSTKTAQRDFDYLRDQLTAPLEFDRARNGFYYTHLQWFLPKTAVNENDLASLRLASRALEAWFARPMAEDLEKIRRKLRDGFEDRITVGVDAEAAPFSFVSPPARKINSRVWETVSRGLLAKKEVAMTYQASGDAPGDRVLCPYHMANLQGEWYVFGHDSRSGEVRQFALWRIRRATLTRKGFNVPGDFNAAKLLEDVFGRFAAPGAAQEVRLVFDQEVAPWVTERQWHPKQKIITKPDGGVELTFKAKGLFEVHRWVLAWGSHCRVLAPAELKTMVEDEVRTMYGHLETKKEGATA